MSDDRREAHRHFSAGCFNAAWDLLEKPDRSADDDARLLATAFASLWHWMQRDDATRQNLSVGYWQVARVFALLGHADCARRFASLCRAASGGLPPFFRAYALEAQARAALLAGACDDAQRLLAEARTLASQVVDDEERKLLVADLDSLA